MNEEEAAAVTDDNEIGFDHSWIKKAHAGDIKFFQDIIKRRHKKDVAENIERMLDNSDKDGDDYSPLCVAAKEGHVKVVHLLCDLGADVNFQQTEWNKSTALMKATERNRVQVVAALLDRNKGTINVDSINTAGNTALMIACEKNHPIIVSLLLQHGANINEVNSMKYTSLILAAEMASIEAMNVLLAFPKADFILLPPGGTFMSGAAAETPARKSRSSLSRSRGRTSSSSSTSKTSSSLPSSVAVHQYIAPDAVQFIGKPTVDLNAKNVFGKTALMMGSENGHLQIVRTLCQFDRIDIEAISGRGATALSLASMKGHTDVVEYLAHDLQASVFCGKDMESSMMQCIDHGYLPILRHLIEFGSLRKPESITTAAPTTTTTTLSVGGGGGVKRRDGLQRSNSASSAISIISSSGATPTAVTATTASTASSSNNNVLGGSHVHFLGMERENNGLTAGGAETRDGRGGSGIAASGGGVTGACTSDSDGGVVGSRTRAGRQRRRSLKAVVTQIQSSQSVLQTMKKYHNQRVDTGSTENAVFGRSISASSNPSSIGSVTGATSSAGEESSGMGGAARGQRRSARSTRIGDGNNDKNKERHYVDREKAFEEEKDHQDDDEEEEEEGCNNYNDYGGDDDDDDDDGSTSIPVYVSPLDRPELRDHKDKEGNTMLLRACKTGQREIVEYLLSLLSPERQQEELLKTNKKEVDTHLYPNNNNIVHATMSSSSSGGISAINNSNESTTEKQKESGGKTNNAVTAAAVASSPTTPNKQLSRPPSLQQQQQQAMMTKKYDCFILACKGGHLNVLDFLLQSASALVKQTAASESNIHLQLLVNAVRNIEGHAMQELIFYFSQHREEFRTFCLKTLSFSKKDYLFALIPRILPHYDSPMSVVNECHDDLMHGLNFPCDTHGLTSQHYQIVPGLLYYAVALKKASNNSLHEQKELQDALDRVEERLSGGQDGIMRHQDMTKPLTVLAAICSETLKQSLNKKPPSLCSSSSSAVSIISGTAVVDHDAAATSTTTTSTTTSIYGGENLSSSSSSRGISHMDMKESIDANTKGAAPVTEQQLQLQLQLSSPYCRSMSATHSMAEYRARAFQYGPLSDYIENGLAGFLVTAQVSHLMDATFSKSQKPRKLQPMLSEAILHGSLRSNSQSVRHVPSAVFFIEGVMKCMALVMLSALVGGCYLEESASECSANSNFESSAAASEMGTTAAYSFSHAHSVECRWFDLSSSFMVALIVYAVSRLLHLYGDIRIGKVSWFDEVSLILILFWLAVKHYESVTNWISALLNNVAISASATFGGDNSSSPYIALFGGTAAAVTDALTRGHYFIESTIPFVRKVTHRLTESIGDIDNVLSATIMMLFFNIQPYTLLHSQFGELTIMVHRVFLDLRWITLMMLVIIVVMIVPFSTLFAKQCDDSVAKVISDMVAASMGNYEVEDWIRSSDATEGGEGSHVFESAARGGGSSGGGSGGTGTVHTSVAEEEGMRPDPLWDFRSIPFYLFVGLENVVLFNLVLARLSASHEKIVNNARGELSMRKATTLKEYLKYPSRHPMCMLAPPLNVLPAVTYVMYRLAFRGDRLATEAAAAVSDWCLSVCTAFWYALDEIQYYKEALQVEGRHGEQYSLFKKTTWYVYYVYRIWREACATLTAVLCSHWFGFFFFISSSSSSRGITLSATTSNYIDDGGGGNGKDSKSNKNSYGNCSSRYLVELQTDSNFERVNGHSVTDSASLTKGKMTRLIRGGSTEGSGLRTESVVMSLASPRPFTSYYSSNNPARSNSSNTTSGAAGCVPSSSTVVSNSFGHLSIGVVRIKLNNNHFVNRVLSPFNSAQERFMHRLLRGSVTCYVKLRFGPDQVCVSNLYKPSPAAYIPSIPVLEDVVDPSTGQPIIDPATGKTKTRIVEVEEIDPLTNEPVIDHSTGKVKMKSLLVPQPTTEIDFKGELHPVFEVGKLVGAEASTVYIDVYDSYGGLFPDVKLASVQTNVRTWITNGRYEGEIKEPLVSDDGLVVGAVQINAHMRYTIQNQRED